jgi:hypothetical protein
MNYLHTLCWNLVSEVEKAVKLLYELNDPKDFKHVIVDLGFPLESDEIPLDIKKSKRNNTKRLRELAERYGSMYMKTQNEGVSQNWTQVYNTLGIKDNDCLICADPDEHPLNEGWVKAIGDVLKSDEKYALIEEYS